MIDFQSLKNSINITRQNKYRKTEIEEDKSIMNNSIFHIEFDTANTALLKMFNPTTSAKNSIDQSIRSLCA